MPPYSVCRASNANFNPSSYIPVAVFVGGTSGIGQAFCETFVEHALGNAHIIIVGRNKIAAEKIFSTFPDSTSSRKDQQEKPKRIFVQCDITLMRNVHRATKEILKQFGKVNFLVISAGFFILRNVLDLTDEGIDAQLSAHYYARWKLINDLLPALLKAQEDGEDVRVVSVLTGGRGKPVNSDDYGLKKTFSFREALRAEPAYNDMMMEELAIRYPTISFSHSFPGTVVRTPIMLASESKIMNMISPYVLWILHPMSISPRECGEYQMYGMMTTAAKPGAYRLGSRGENLESKGYVALAEERKKLWEHSVETTKVKDL